MESIAMLLLPPNEAHLYYLPTADRPDLVSEAALALFRSWMTEEESARCTRYLFEHSRREYILTRALLRSVLSLYAGVEPAEWRFRSGSHGKPVLTAPQGHDHIHFNLSNTNGLIALLLLRDHEVGVDVEDTERQGQNLEIADRYFSGQETRDLLACPARERPRRFFEYWTLKEAYIKARGLGLSIPLDQFSFVLDQQDQAITIQFDPRWVDDPTRWQFAQLRLTPVHACAVALMVPSHPPIPLRIRQMHPAQRTFVDESDAGLITRR